jgi:hypothetical protein
MGGQRLNLRSRPGRMSFSRKVSKKKLSVNLCLQSLQYDRIQFVELENNDAEM